MFLGFGSEVMRFCLSKGTDVTYTRLPKEPLFSVWYEVLVFLFEGIIVTNFTECVSHACVSNV